MLHVSVSYYIGFCGEVTLLYFINIHKRTIYIEYASTKCLKCLLFFFMLTLWTFKREFHFAPPRWFEGGNICLKLQSYDFIYRIGLI